MTGEKIIKFGKFIEKVFNKGTRNLIIDYLREKDSNAPSWKKYLN